VSEPSPDRHRQSSAPPRRAGTGFVAGTSSATVAQSVGAWTGSGARSGSQTYSLPNSWAYAPGTYTTTLNYTLSVP
jgi:hypothetical protein